MSSPAKALPACFLVALGAALGCVAPPYRPAQPHRAAGAGLRIDITKIQTLGQNGPELVVWADLDGDPGVELRRALVAPRKAEPCHEGVRAKSLVVDGESPWLRPVAVGGKHDLVLRFAPGAAQDLLREAAAIDFVVAAAEGDRCVRVTLTGHEPSDAWAAPLAGVVGASIRGYAPANPVGGVGSGWSFGDYLGGYLGPLRLQADFGFGSANCRSDCLGGTGGFLWFPLGASAHMVLVESGSFSLDVGLGYRAMFASTIGKESSRRLRLDAPELSVRFAGTAEQGPGLPKGHRVASGGIEVFVADWSAGGAAGTERSLVLGMGFVWDHGF
jgi:hypothetical protein